jgi:hypothetical protein
MNLEKLSTTYYQYRYAELKMVDCSSNRVGVYGCGLVMVAVRFF